MKHRFYKLCLLLVLFTFSAAFLFSGEFKAYYTKLSNFEDEYFGKYSDIVVEIPSGGSLVFAAENSYLPYWKNAAGEKFFLEELVERAPDNHNLCSRAAIVERSEEQIIVHWRYVPDVHSRSFKDFSGEYNKYGEPSRFYADFVDEYFTIKSDGLLERKVKNGCLRLEEWRDPDNAISQTIRLNANGVELLGKRLAKLKKAYKQKAESAPLRNFEIPQKLVNFSFDEAVEGGGRETLESVGGSECTLNGAAVYWRKGVSQTAIHFDGYSNFIKLDRGILPQPDSAFSLSVWLALQEYPFNIAAIVDCLDAEAKEGFLLGVNRGGELILMLGDSNSIESVKLANLELYKWQNIILTLEAKSKKAQVFINGVLMGSANLKIAPKFSEKAPVHIAMTRSFKQYPEGAEREITKKFKSFFGLNALMDELCIFEGGIDSKFAKSIFEAYKPESLEALRPYPLPYKATKRRKFEASYAEVKYTPFWDGLWRVGDYADLIVTFEDEPWAYIFWRGTRYLPSLVTDGGFDGIWSSDQGPEVFLGQCYEHMSDMLCRHSQVRLINSSPARVVVHWRNASVNIEYKFPVLDDKGRGVWTDEYWTIYPDGTSVRHQRTYNPKRIGVIEMNQNEILHHPNQRSKELFMGDAVVLGNEKGEVQRWFRGRDRPDREISGACNLLYTNLKSGTKQFQIGRIGTRIDVELHKEVWWRGWDHYPVQLIPSDGTANVKYDKPASSCVSTFREHRKHFDNGITEAMQIYGLTRKQPEELRNLNRSWNFAPDMEPLDDTCEYIVYKKSEKAYHIASKSERVRFRIKASQDKPLENPAFVFKNFEGEIGELSLSVNGKVIENPKFGVEFNDEGKRDLAIWFKYSADKSVDFEIKLR